MKITAIVAAVCLLTPQVFGDGWCRGYYNYDYGYSSYKKPRVKERVRVVEKGPDQVINLANIFPQGSTQYTTQQSTNLYATNPQLC